MNTDALARRLRFAKPNPRVKRIIPNDGDFDRWSAIDYHGWLPVNYLYEFSKARHRNYSNVQFRMTEQYNGDSGGSYVTRPPAQFNAFDARYQHLVYGLTSRAEGCLSDRTLYPLRKTNDFVHDLMVACVTASVRLNTLGLDFVKRDELLGKDNKLSIDTGSQVIYPDDLFGLRFPSGNTKRFVLEADRNSEPIRGGSKHSFGRKIDAYLDLMRKPKLIQAWIGARKVNVFTVTTNRTHAINLAGYVKKATESEPHLREFFSFAVATDFGSRGYTEEDQHWRVPKTLLTDLLKDPILP